MMAWWAGTVQAGALLLLFCGGEEPVVMLPGTGGW
jgi:hypothetical protein